MIYFIRSQNGRIKIGYTANIAKRMADLQTAHPEPLSLIVAIPGDMSAERALHRRFMADRLEGEWFDPSPVLISYLTSLLEEKPIGEWPPDIDELRSLLAIKPLNQISEYYRIKLSELVKYSQANGLRGPGFNYWARALREAKKRTP